MRRSRKANEDDDLDDEERKRRQAFFMAYVCKLSGVPVKDYEAWLDTMSPEYFVLYCDELLDEDNANLLMRVT